MKPHLHDIEHSVIAFYGFAINGKLIDLFYSKALAWFNTFQCPPHLMAGSKKLCRFAAAEKGFKTHGFSDTTYLEIYSLSKGAKDPSEGFELEVSLAPKGVCFVNFRTSILSVG